MTALIQGPASVNTEIATETGYLEKIRGEFEAVGVPTEGELVYGEPVKEIVKWVQERGCDLVAMSTHGHRGLADLLFGQTASLV